MLQKIYFLFGLLIGLILVWGSSSATTTSTTLMNARLFINKINRNMFPRYEELHRLTFNKQPDEYIANIDSISKTINEIAGLIKEAQTFSLNEIDDADLRLALQNIRNSAYLYILGSDYYKNLKDIFDEMMLPALKKTICEYKDIYKCDLSYIPDITNMIASNSYDPDQLLYYWSEWRAGIEVNSRPLFPIFINLFKLAANETGVSPVEFLYNYYNDDITIIQNMKQVMEEFMPFYKEFHAYVRHELNAKYGNEIVSITAPIPDHLLQVVVLQAWKKNSILQQPYPDSKLPNLKAGLQKENINIQAMIDITENYYTSLGLSPLSRNIKNNFKKKTDNELGSQCKAEIYDQTPNVRMEYCPQINIKKFLQLHGYMGRVYYAYEKRDLPFHFFNSYKFEKAVGEAVILSASSPQHLENVGIIPHFIYTPELDMNRLFRMGVHTFFTIPVYYVHIKLIEDILSGAVNLRNINVHYWNLMEEYVGVEPPINRNIEALDLSYKFFENLKANQLVPKFISEILGYQLYESLCTLAEKYGPNIKEQKLHDCNFEGHREVGEVLKNMMKLGSKKPWRETLSAVTGNINGLSAKGLLNYYAPLREWLQNQIKQKNIDIGWRPSTKALTLKHADPR